jgi:chorismate mutase
MSNERIKKLLAQLREELESTDVDDDLQKLMGELDDEIHGVIENDADVNALVDRAKELEAEFATKHPAAERFMREVIDALVHMGI